MGCLRAAPCCKDRPGTYSEGRAAENPAAMSAAVQGSGRTEGFQTAEFLLEHGFIDKIVERKDLKDTLSNLVKLHKMDGLKK